MRKLLSLIFVVTAIVAGARQVSPDEAKTIATEFFNRYIAKSAPHRTARFAANKKYDVEPYYIFNASDGNGFVIISGDTRAKKIIGYSDRGSFDTANMPPQLTAMLEQYAMQLSTLPESYPPDTSWSSSQTRSEEGGVLLETANWDQQYPFNLMTPENCLTGCVPTSVAIIMRYHKWPETGLGSTSYELNGHTVSFDFDNAYFNWDLMPLDYIEGQYTEEQALEVSKAMYAAGNAVHAGYGHDETFANLPTYGMYRYLKYEVPKRDVVIQDALNLCLNKFLQTIHSEVTASRPMLLDIKMNTYIDHFVVADGFDSQNNVHLNYGWGGSANGFYNPEVIINFTRYFYSNIRPDRKATNDREEILPDDGALSNSNTGGPLRSGLVILGDIKPNEDFGFIYHIAFPIEPLPNFKLGLLHISSQGSIKDVLWSEILDLSVENGDVLGQSWTSITKNIEDDDRVTLAYKKEETDGWHIIKDTPNAKASISITNQERDYLHFSVVSDSGVDLFVGAYAIIEDQKDLWNYSGKIEKCYFNLSASVNEPYMLGPFTLHNNIGCATVSINGLEIGQIEVNYLGNVPIVETKISDVFNFASYLPDHIIIKVKKYLYDEMLSIVKHVDKAGTLHQLLTLDDAKNTRSLTLTGQIDLNDLNYVENNCPFLQLLDMSEADIKDGVLPCNVYCKSTKMLQQIKLPRNLKSIENESFMDENGHGGIRVVFIPASVEEIGDRAFMWGQISSVVMANPKPIDVRGLHEAPFRCASVIYVPKGSKLAYENSGWGQYWNGGEFYERKVIEYDGDFIPIDNLSFSSETITMEIGESISVNPVIHPINATEQLTGSLRLNDLGGGIILKDNNCIEAIREGCGLLTVNHSNFYAHLLVNVIAKPILVESIIISPANIEDEIGKEFQLTTAVSPENATNKEITWSSDNEDVAIVDKTGLLKLNATGSTFITASALDGSGVYAKCQVIVNDNTCIEEILTDKDVEVKIYNMTGLLIYEGKYSDANLSKGIYIVIASNSTKKLLLK